MGTKRITVRLTTQECEQLQRLSDANKVDVSTVVRASISRLADLHSFEAIRQRAAGYLEKSSDGLRLNAIGRQTFQEIAGELGLPLSDAMRIMTAWVVSHFKLERPAQVKEGR
jgi:hypothetical protein